MEVHWVSGSERSGDEVDGAEDARGQGLDFVEILHLEAVSVFGDQRFVVSRRVGGPGVEGGVEDADLDLVGPRFEEFSDVE